MIAISGWHYYRRHQVNCAQSALHRPLSRLACPLIKLGNSIISTICAIAAVSGRSKFGKFQLKIYRKTGSFPWRLNTCQSLEGLAFRDNLGGPNMLLAHNVEKQLYKLVRGRRRASNSDKKALSVITTLWLRSGVMRCAGDLCRLQREHPFVIIWKPVGLSISTELA